MSISRNTSLKHKLINCFGDALVNLLTTFKSIKPKSHTFFWLKACFTRYYLCRVCLPEIEIIIVMKIIEVDDR